MIEFAVAADYAIVYGVLRLNGTTSIAELALAANASAAISQQILVVTTYKFAVGDFVEIRALQDNTANVARNLLAQPNRSPEFWATWVGRG